MSAPIICCPHCRGKIEIAAREVQVELPLGPIEFSVKKKLDGNFGASLQSNGSVNPSTNSDSERLTDYPLTASCEEGLLVQIQQILGENEMRRNGGLWRYYLRLSQRAVAYAIEDWKLRTPDQQRQIKNRPAWLTDRYKRARDEITKARQVAYG